MAAVYGSATPGLLSLPSDEAGPIAFRIFGQAVQRPYSFTTRRIIVLGTEYMVQAHHRGVPISFSL